MKKTKFVQNVIIPALFFATNSNLSSGQSPIAKVGKEAPEWEIEKFIDSPDATSNIYELKGKVIVLDFWGTWCGPCIASFSHVNELIDNLRGKDVQFITVGYEDTEKAKKVLERHKVKAWMALDTDLSVFTDYDAWTIPLVYIINKEGIVAGKIHPSDLNTDMIETVLNGKKIEGQNNSDSPYHDPVGAKEHFLKAINY